MHSKTNKSNTLGPQAAHLITTLYERNRPMLFGLKEVEKILHMNEKSSRRYGKRSSTQLKKER